MWLYACYSSDMIKVDTEELKQLESDLQEFAEKAFPFATRNTVNTAAFEARERIQAGMRKKMVMRNTFTIKSVQVEKARTLRVKDQEAVVGSTAPYMEDQEFGATKAKRGKHGVAIPTSVASGEGRGTQPRRRVARRANKKASIRLSKIRVKAKSKGQEANIRVKHAAATGKKFVFLDLPKHPGIYKVSGGKRRPKIDLVHDMSRKSIRIPRTPTFAPATFAVQKRMPSIYLDSIIFQLKRQGLFKD